MNNYNNTSYNMEPIDKERSESYFRAKKKVDERKGFYYHALTYVLVNLFISIIIVFGRTNDGESFADSLFDFGTFSVWIFWGIGLLIHGVNTFGHDKLFGKNWEERKIEQYMKEDKEGFKKYK